MLWLYDNAIAEDLASCVDSSGGANSIVRVIEPDGVPALIAQMKEDKIEFPLMCLVRNQETPIDTQRANFTRMHSGVATGYNARENAVYFEKAAPIKLAYTLYVLATNTVDMDELTRELLFRYLSNYYIKLSIPYGAIDREIRVGLKIDDEGIKKDSASIEYIQGGKLYQASMTLNVEGAVLITYTSRHASYSEEATIEAK